jgi:4-hydroxy-tetrahydrodipicolinate reductase
LKIARNPGHGALGGGGPGGIGVEKVEGIPVVVAGLGPVGRAIALAALATPELQLVGAVDPAFAGKKLGDLLDRPGLRMQVESDPARALRAARGGVLLQATSSRVDDVLPLVEQAVKAGLSVASTCEELAYPWLAHEEEADALDALAERHGVAVVAAGVNPGLALDRLPALLSQATGAVHHLRGLRVVDLAGRRPGLVRKAGVGLSPERFERALEADEIGHVGLSEAVALAALGSGLDLDEVEEEAEPVRASRDLPGSLPVKKGMVAGIRQVARAWWEGREVARLELVLALGAEDPRDEIWIEADPPLRLLVPGGLPGEAATAWSIVHAAGSLPMLRGLVTVLDLPPGRS